MSFDKVIWSEGMFIRAQHFQQDARYVERLIRSRSKGLRPYGWGLTELRLNRELLSIGRFGVERASGVFADGTPFSIPADVAGLQPLVLNENVRNAIVYLTLPISQPAPAASRPPTGQASSTGRPRPPILPCTAGLIASTAATAGSRIVR